MTSIPPVVPPLPVRSRFALDLPATSGFDWLAAGWREEEVEKGLAAFAEVPFAIPVPRPRPYLSARETFFYLLQFTALYVSSFNHGFDPRVYIDADPADRVVQYHVAGHTNRGTHIIDTHSDHAIPEVWELYRRAWARTGPVATLYEWDENIPEFEVVHAEARKALACRGAGEPVGAAHGA